jgi:putative oxidoreductase
MLAQQRTIDRYLEMGESVKDRFNGLPLSIPLTLARLAIAGVFFRSGMTKIANWDLTVQLFENEYHLPLLPPDLAAAMAASLELSVPVFLILGLFTRFAVLPLLGMTAIIEIFVYPQNWPEHLTWATLMIFLLLRGAGIYSLDYVIARAWRALRRATPAVPPTESGDAIGHLERLTECLSIGTKRERRGCEDLF